MAIRLQKAATAVMIISFNFNNLEILFKQKTLPVFLLFLKLEQGLLGVAHGEQSLQVLVTKPPFRRKRMATRL